jgi:hypothetical protein
MPKAAKKYSTTAPAIDPVVELSKKLLVLWDADDGSQREYNDIETVPEHVKDDTLEQFGEWRDAIEKIISYTQPANLQGALVQMALACDTLNDLHSFIEAGDRKAIDCDTLQLDRLLRSAMRAVRAAIPTEINPAVRSIVKIYSGDYDHNPIWIDNVKGWAEKGSELRVREGD